MIPENIKKEFEKDMEELLARDDIQCREDICDAFYAKCMKLLKRPSSEDLLKVFYIMNTLAGAFHYAPAALWLGDFYETRMGNLLDALNAYRQAAELGDPQGAFRLANMLAAGKGVSRDLAQAREYYVFAASHGIPEAIFMLGEYLRNEGKRQEALTAYKDAAAKGYAPAENRVRQLMKHYN